MVVTSGLSNEGESTIQSDKVYVLLSAFKQSTSGLTCLYAEPVKGTSQEKADLWATAVEAKLRGDRQIPTGLISDTADNIADEFTMETTVQWAWQPNPDASRAMSRINAILTKHRYPHMQATDNVTRQLRSGTSFD